jgi:hypothetical protein
MNTPMGIHVIEEFDRSAMMPYYVKARAAYPDMPDFDSIRFYWGTSYRTLGWAEPARNGGAYYIVISRPYMRAISREYPQEYTTEFEDTMLHELAHTSVQYRESKNEINLLRYTYKGKQIYRGHGREWRDTFGEATDHVERCANNPRIDWVKVGKLAEKIAKEEF